MLDRKDTNEKDTNEKDTNKIDTNRRDIHIKNFVVTVTKILVPRDEKKKKKWSVIACDQYTSQLDYWERVE